MVRTVLSVVGRSVDVCSVRPANQRPCSISGTARVASRGRPSAPVQRFRGHHRRGRLDLLHREPTTTVQSPPRTRQRVHALSPPDTHQHAQ